MYSEIIDNRFLKTFHENKYDSAYSDYQQIQSECFLSVKQYTKFSVENTINA
jgi:hypothetical protein